MSRLIIFTVDKALKCYWFLFRPKTFGVKGLLIDDGKILLVKPTYSKFFSMPGGGIKRGETAEDAVKREVKEETGVEVLKCHLVGEYKNKSEYKNDHISLFYIDDFIVGKKSYRRYEIEECGFYSLDDLPENVSKRNSEKFGVNLKEVERGIW